MLLLIVCCGVQCRPRVDRSRNMIRKTTEINREILDNDTDRKLKTVTEVVRKNNELLKDNLPEDYEDMYEDYNAPIINIRFKRAMEEVKNRLAKTAGEEIGEGEEEEEIIDNKTNSLRKIKNRKGKKSNRSLRKSNRRRNRRQRMRNRMKNLS